MGLDIVEFVMTVEESFGIRIPDKDAATLGTPRLVIDYIAMRLNAASGSTSACLTQAVFYRTRAATAQRFGLDRKALRPQTVLAYAMGDRRSEWKALRDDVGSKEWPRLKSDNWLGSSLGGVSTLGELARHLATCDVAAMRDPNSPWTREEIKALVVGLIETELGVDMSRYTLDSRFVDDMGVD